MCIHEMRLNFASLRRRVHCNEIIYRTFAAEWRVQVAIVRPWLRCGIFTGSQLSNAGCTSPGLTTMNVRRIESSTVASPIPILLMHSAGIRLRRKARRDAP